MKRHNWPVPPGTPGCGDLRCDVCGRLAKDTKDEECPGRPSEEVERLFVGKREIENQLILVATHVKAKCPSPGTLADGILEKIGELEDRAAMRGSAAGQVTGLRQAMSVAMNAAKGKFERGQDEAATALRDLALEFERRSKDQEKQNETPF